MTVNLGFLDSASPAGPSAAFPLWPTISPHHPFVHPYFKLVLRYPCLLTNRQRGRHHSTTSATTTTTRGSRRDSSPAPGMFSLLLFFILLLYWPLVFRIYKMDRDVFTSRGNFFLLIISLITTIYRNYVHHYHHITPYRQESDGSIDTTNG
jgi:hypothetical protein